MRLPGAVVWMEIISETKLKDSSGGDSFCFKTLFTKNMCVYEQDTFVLTTSIKRGFPPLFCLFVCFV